MPNKPLVKFNQAPSLANPTVYRMVSDQLRQRGYKTKEIESALGERVAREQAPSMLEAGLIDPQAAIEAMGGMGAPGLFEAMRGYEPEEEKKIRSGTESKLISMAKSGLDSAKNIRSKLATETGDIGGGKWGLELYGASTPLSPYGRGLESDLFNLADAILRLRTGAAAPDKEVKRYMKNKLPSVWDSKDTRKAKLESAEKELMNLLESMDEEYIHEEKTKRPLKSFDE